MENTIYHCSSITNHNLKTCCNRCHDLADHFIARSNGHDYTLCCHAIGHIIGLDPTALIVKDIDGEMIITPALSSPSLSQERTHAIAVAESCVVVFQYENNTRLVRPGHRRLSFAKHLQLS
jgi:hypothetical protein